MLVASARSREAEGIRSVGPAQSEELVPSEGLAPSGELVPEEHVWVLPDQVEHLPLPVAQRKILELARIAMAAPALAAPALAAPTPTR